MSLLDEFRAAMTVVAAKVVAKNDVAKRAYHTPEPQQRVMRTAGYTPVPSTDRRIIQIREAGTDNILESSYYASRVGTDRDVEPRIGRDRINWAREGETLWLGTDGTTVFAMKGATAGVTAPADPDERESPSEKLAKHLNRNRLIHLVNAVGGPPGRRATDSLVYERNALVMAFARERSGGVCEMPNCGVRGFIKTDGSIYIEVHHIVLMGNQGEDVIGNVAALCANCHKRAHYARERNTIRTQLLAAVQAENIRFVPTLR